ncbi:hypothetical protein [Flavobacterium sp. UBA4197]|uniref:hypothetical protein n=1 Tax=Flavobacterium sp. UBA4197 TaxID=1946546 RepID=UPI002579DEA4|nr:hypothetical protein [Flavobacterium sp. UBA4197]HRB72447.1 hypothetical protein [Flavobacterium sp.]
MSATKEFNELHGKEVSRVYLNGLIVRAKKEQAAEVVTRITAVLKNNPGIDRFRMKISNKISLGQPNQKKVVKQPNTTQIKAKLINKPTAGTRKKAVKKASPTGLNKSSQTTDNANLKNLEKLGFVVASNTPDEPADVFLLPGEIGKFLQKIQPHKALIIIKGTKHTSKSQLAMQIANAFAERKEPIAYIDYEQGGLESKDTVDSINRNTSELGRKYIAVKGYLEKPMEELKEFCKYCKVIVADSVTDLGITADQLNELRVGFPKVIWVFISQVRENGAMYGGNKMAHNPTVIIECHPSENPAERYATLEKNRGNDLSLKYSMYTKKLIREESKVNLNRTLSFKVA